MEATNQQIISSLLAIDGRGKEAKRDNLKLLLNRIKENDPETVHFYIDMLLKEC